MQRFPPSERVVCASSGRLTNFGPFKRCAYPSYGHAASPSGLPWTVCECTEERFHPESIYYISGRVFRLNGDASAPLSLETISAALHQFRLGRSVPLREFQRLLRLMASVSLVCHLGLLHMGPLQLWLKDRVLWRAWTNMFTKCSAGGFP